jgi:cytochrome c peroxidase
MVMTKNKILAFLVITAFVLISLTKSSANDTSIGVSNSINYYKKGVLSFVASNQKLNVTLKAINTDISSVIEARKALKDCRLEYKKIEFFTSYFFLSETHFYNAAPKFEVEEPTLELVEPMGLQQIENLLFEDDVLSNKALLIKQSDAMLSSAEDLNSLLYGFKANDAQILESLRIELIRMSVLSISGYDAPMLKSGIAETAAATKALQEILKPYIQAHPVQGKPLNDLITNSLIYLKSHSDFDMFNRLEYLTDFALPMQKQMGLFIKQQYTEINTTQFLNYKAEHIYSKNALKGWDSATADPVRKKELAALGKQLFFDKSLSGNLSTSCGSCHRPENYFADVLPKSRSIQPDSTLKRNTPTLMYAGWQHSQFWDGRANGLKDQIRNVIFNPEEMNSTRILLNQVINKKDYRNLFKASFPDKSIENMGINEISEAITAFIEELSPMDSPFDHYINGNHAAMTREQIEGFNLFMGKAQCGTCHFPPYFNSLLPPLYDLSEVEILGTTKTDDLKNPECDQDQGRYDLYHIRYYKAAFKVPTVRNSAKTAPYMHNGSFKSLAKVLEFYNHGGGRGLGLDVKDQTLSAKPLYLSEKEINNLIAFIESLTDLNTKYLN